MQWFDEKYGRSLGRRHATFSRALSLLLERSGPSRTIVETGCVREKNDYGAGYSTVLFGEVLARFGGRLHTVDISQRNIAVCRRLIKPYAARIATYVGDSIAFLREWPATHPDTPIDLLYLDSFDYPVFEERPREPSQQHCLGELDAALPSLGERAVVLIDDADLPGGGKPLFAKRRLSELGWRCELDDYQTLWVRGR